MDGFANLSGPGAENKTVDDWITMGNKHYQNKNYEEAIKSYFFGMMKEPFNVRLLSNRSAAYMHHGYYWLALNDADLVLTKGNDPLHEKAVYRKTKSLFGLGRYEEGIEFISSIKKKVKSPARLKICDQLIKEGNTYMNQAKYGDNYYDILEMIKSKWTHIIRGEYTGPLKVSKIKGKGRGLIATEDIRPGQLIMAHRAFGIYFGQDFDEKDGKDEDKDKDKPGDGAKDKDKPEDGAKDKDKPEDGAKNKDKAEG